MIKTKLNFIKITNNYHLSLSFTFILNQTISINKNNNNNSLHKNSWRKYYKKQDSSLWKVLIKKIYKLLNKLTNGPLH